MTDAINHATVAQLREALAHTPQDALVLMEGCDCDQHATTTIKGERFNHTDYVLIRNVANLEREVRLARAHAKRMARRDQDGGR